MEAWIIGGGVVATLVFYTAAVYNIGRHTGRLDEQLRTCVNERHDPM